jgi:CDP-6-deoxy-D-xylo-4-hexulose-3-dehydrase
VREYFERHMRPADFVPGKTPVPYGGRVFDAAEMEALTDQVLDFWLTAGPAADEFEKRVAEWIGIKYGFFVNSGSSALLLAVTALADRSLGERRLKPGDEVITPAMGFPTTVAPIVQAGAVPVLVDVELPYYNPSAAAVKAAVTPKTRAVVIAHALGNPFDAEGILQIAREHDLWVIEDNCDALGGRLNGKLTGTFGHMATLSFYASHQMTTGEGGMVVSGSDELAAIVRSLRDWGRDCVCAPGKDDTCGERFTGRFGTLPEGYDHKYVFARLGYNLKATDMQAAVGLAQLGKLDGFVSARKNNFTRIKNGLAGLEDRLVLPEATPGSDPCWFGFALTVTGKCPLSRNELVAELEKKKIATRMFFGGNIARQPAFAGVEHRVSGGLAVSDRITLDSFWVGVYPGLTGEMCGYIAQSIRDAVSGGGSRSG